MNSVFHARSSSKKFGGDWSDYHDLHHFLDSSKAFFASVPHRLFLHTNDLGRSLLTRKFGQYIRNHDNVEVPVDAIMDQHLDEDFYFRPKLSDWLAHASFQDTRLDKSRAILQMKTKRGSWIGRPIQVDVIEWLDDPVGTAVLKHSGTRADYQGLYEFFDLPSLSCSHDEANLVLENSFGIFLAESVFGPVLETSSGRRIPTRIVAEKFVCARRGYIPCPATLAGSVSLKEWMIGTNDTRRHP